MNKINLIKTSLVIAGITIALSPSVLFAQDDTMTAAPVVDAQQDQQKQNKVQKTKPQAQQQAPMKEIQDVPFPKETGTD